MKREKNWLLREPCFKHSNKTMTMIKRIGYLVVLVCFTAIQRCPANCPSGWELVSEHLCYFAEPRLLTFDEAARSCIYNHGIVTRLASVWSKAEHEIIINFAQRNFGNETAFWSGRFAEMYAAPSTSAYWRWRDGSAYSYVNWEPEVDRTPDVTKALIISTSDDGYATPTNLTEKFASVCKHARSRTFEITHRNRSTINLLSPTQRWTSDVHALFFAHTHSPVPSVKLMEKDVEFSEDCYLWCLTIDNCVQVQAVCRIWYACKVTRCYLNVTP